jgi:hypothetical protein
MKRVIAMFLGTLGCKILRTSTFNALQHQAPALRDEISRLEAILNTSEQDKARLLEQVQSLRKQGESTQQGLDAMVRQTAPDPPPYHWIHDYVEWTKRVFGRPVFPVIETSLKAVSSLLPEDAYFQACANGLMAAEMDYVADLLADIRSNDVPGAFLEFGVFEGRWINILYEETRKSGLDREIWGFDSFEGLSIPDVERDIDFWKEGMFAAGIALVRKNVKADERPAIKLVKGFFADSLLRPESQALGPVAYARIDCDIYGPTVECLDYLSHRLSHGAVLAFDDWSHNHNFGETRAFAEWVDRVPNLEFEFLFYGFWDHFYVRVWHKDRPRWKMKSFDLQTKAHER